MIPLPTLALPSEKHFWQSLLTAWQVSDRDNPKFAERLMTSIYRNQNESGRGDRFCIVFGKNLETGFDAGYTMDATGRLFEAFNDRTLSGTTSNIGAKQSRALQESLLTHRLRPTPILVTQKPTIDDADVGIASSAFQALLRSRLEGDVDVQMIDEIDVKRAKGWTVLGRNDIENIFSAVVALDEPAEWAALREALPAPSNKRDLLKAKWLEDCDKLGVGVVMLLSYRDYYGGRVTMFSPDDHPSFENLFADGTNHKTLVYGPEELLEEGIRHTGAALRTVRNFVARYFPDACPVEMAVAYAVPSGDYIVQRLDSKLKIGEATHTFYVRQRADDETGERYEYFEVDPAALNLDSLEEIDINDLDKNVRDTFMLAYSSASNTTQDDFIFFLQTPAEAVQLELNPDDSHVPPAPYTAAYFELNQSKKSFDVYEQSPLSPA